MMDLGISDKVKPILEEVKSFIDVEILPLEMEYHKEVGTGDRWTFTDRQTEILESLKSKAKSRNLWNFFSNPLGRGLWPQYCGICLYCRRDWTFIFSARSI